MAAGTVVVIGRGLVGTRTATALEAAGVDVRLVDRDGSETLPRYLRPAALVLATESMHQVTLARRWLDRGAAVIATAGRPDAVRALLGLGGVADAARASIFVGAACAPGLSTLLVRRLARDFSSIDAVTTARFGTGGPVCAREHHRSMAAAAAEVRDGELHWSRGGSGRQLVWFPEPVGPQDCYRAGLAEPILLQRALPGIRRIQSLQAATRRDRLTARLPMLRPPHPEGLRGAVWVEVRGRRAGGAIDHASLAATATQATAAAAVATAIVRRCLEPIQSFRPGVVDWTDPAHELLRALGPDVALWEPDGTSARGTGTNGPLRAARKWGGLRNSAGSRPTGPGSGVSGRIA